MPNTHERTSSITVRSILLIPQLSMISFNVPTLIPYGSSISIRLMNLPPISSRGYVAERVKKLKKDHANVELDKTTLHMVLGGMRGMTALVWLGSAVDPDEGIRFRGMTIPECQKALPGAFPGGEPLPEAILWLLLTGKIPNKEQVDSLAQELRRRAKIPEYAFKAIDALPVSAHPMTQFSTGVMAPKLSDKFFFEF